MAIVYDHLPDFDESYPYVGSHPWDLAQCMMEGNIKILQIYGAVYLGKTLLAKTVAREYGKRRQSPIHLYMVNLSLCESLEDFLKNMSSQVCDHSKKNLTSSQMQLSLQSRRNSNLFIVDGVQGSEPYLADILQLVVTLAEDALFIVTSRVHICFGRFIDRGQYYEHLCRPMLPRDAKELLQLVARNPRDLHQFEDEIVKLTKRVPMAIILAGQKMQRRPNVLEFSPEDLVTLLKRSTFDTLNLQFAASQDKIVTVLGDYFQSLNRNERKFFLRLEKSNSVDTFTMATAYETAPETSPAVIKHNTIAPIMDKSFISLGVADDQGGRSFLSNEWLSDFIKEHFPAFIAHSGNEFADKICDFMNTFLKGKGYTQIEIDKVHTTKTTITKPLKEALTNLIVWDGETQEESKSREERSALRVQIIEAAKYLLRNGFPHCKPMEFAKEALKILTEWEDSELKTITIVNGSQQVDREPRQLRAGQGPESVAKVTIKPDRRNKQFFNDVPPGVLQKQVPSFDAAENTQIQGQANPHVPSEHTMLTASSTNNNASVVSSSHPDHTGLVNQEYASTSEKIGQQIRGRRNGTSDQVESSGLKSSESWGARSAESLGQLDDYSVFSTDSNFKFGDSEIHTLKSYSTDLQRRINRETLYQEQPTLCASNKLPVANTEEAHQRRESLSDSNNNAIAEAESYKDAKHGRDSSHIQSAYRSPRAHSTKDCTHNHIQPQNYYNQHDQPIERHIQQMTLNPQGNVSATLYSPNQTIGPLSSREPNQVIPSSLSSPNECDHLGRSRQHSSNHCQPHNTIPGGTPYQTTKFVASDGSQSHSCSQVPTSPLQKHGDALPHSVQSVLPSQTHVTAGHVLSPDYNNHNQNNNRMDPNHCREDASDFDSSHNSQSRSGPHSGYQHERSDTYGHLIPKYSDVSEQQDHYTRNSCIPESKYTQPNNQVLPPGNQLSSPNNQISTSSNNLLSPPNHHQSIQTSNQFVTPTPSNTISSPSYQVSTPKEQLFASSHQSFQPYDQFSPSGNREVHQCIQTNNQVSPPSNQFSQPGHSFPPNNQSPVPSNQFTFPNNQLHTQNNQLVPPVTPPSVNCPSQNNTQVIPPSEHYPSQNNTQVTPPSVHYPSRNNQFPLQIPQETTQQPTSRFSDTSSASPSVFSPNKGQYPRLYPLETASYQIQYPGETTPYQRQYPGETASYQRQYLGETASYKRQYPRETDSYQRQYETASCQRPHPHCEGQSTVYSPGVDIAHSRQAQITQSGSPQWSLQPSVSSPQWDFQPSASSSMNISPQQAQSHAGLPFQSVAEQTQDYHQSNPRPPALPPGAATM